MSEEQRRSTKLIKQVEVEDDEDGEDGKSESFGATVVAGVATPTVQSATSSSGTSPEETQPKPPMTRKQTLTRTPALDGTSPPPDSFFASIRSNGSSSSAAAAEGQHISNGAVDKSDQLKKASTSEAKEFLLASHKVSNDSGHGTIDHNDGSSDTSVLSRDSSLETSGTASKRDIYRDSTGVDMKMFMRETLQKSAKDRKTVLSCEAKILAFIQDRDATTLSMPEMTSYDRMIVHRLAAYVGLEHNVDASGKCVILQKTENTRYKKLSEEVMNEEETTEVPKKTILAKKPLSFDDHKTQRCNPKGQMGPRAKSLEERQQSYKEARDRIFSEQSQDGQSVTALLPTIPYPIPNQRSLDSMRPSSTSRWPSQESSGYGMDSSSSSLRSARLRANMTKSNSYGGTVTTHSNSHFSMGPYRTVSLNKSESSKEFPHMTTGPMPICQQPTPAATPGEEALHVCRSPADIVSLAHQPSTPFAYLVSSDYSSIPVGSLIINPHTMQPHVNLDGTPYRFDPNNPPPFMLQPQPQQVSATPPMQSIYHPQEMIEFTNRMINTSVTSLETGSEAYSLCPHSQPMHVVPHHQNVYSNAHPAAPYAQPQYYTPVPTGSSNVRFMATVVPGPCQPVFPATPMDSQGQPAIPMPSVGVPAVMGAGGYQVVQPQHYQQGSGNPPHSLDLSSGYHFAPGHETVVVSTATAGGVGSSVAMGAAGAPHFIPTYNIAYTQPQQASAPTGTFYTVPHTPTPPLALTQPPPSSHHQQPPQQTVFYQPSAANLTLSPVSYSPGKPYVFRPPTPPQQHQPSQQVIHHHQQQPQPVVAASANGHHTAPLTLNYGQPMTFNPAGQPLSQLPTQGSSFVAFQPNPYPMRPVGTVIQIASSPMQAQQPMAGPQGQPYQVLRPTGPAQDLRALNPGGVRPRLSSLPLSNQHIHQTQTRPKSSGIYRPTKNKFRKGGRESEDLSGSQQMGHHMNIITPLLPTMTSPNHGHAYIPSTPSNRQ